ncbi:hypothetical protein N824_24880 [Pedobacter sp. V48]|nr:hypothetical protein N824_24880 [Pedobacter sp. V48]
MGNLMIRTCCLLSLICSTGTCLAQPKDAYYGEIITKIDYTNNGADTSRLLYCRNAAGNRLSIYTGKDDMQLQIIP